MPSDGRDDQPPFDFDPSESKSGPDEQPTGDSIDGPPAEDETVSWDGKQARRRGDRFTIVRSHARGGLGVVHIAHDNELDREVALKEIREKHADDPQARERFIREAQITAKLGHPNICPVHSLGTDDKGRPYYAMSLVLGRTLQDAIAEFHASAKSRSSDLLHSVEFRALLQSLVDVCGAVAYAHNRKVLHRDLKPSNIMLGPYGETILLDWGLAKSVASDATTSLDAEPPIRLTGSHDSQETLPGAAVGTPSYMSPEQAGGRSDRVGPTTDVYGLGATLYAILTGVAPVKESTKEETLERVAKGKFQPPRAVNPRIPKPLESICLKAMSREPDQRYHTPKELAKDIERWLADEPVSSHTDSAWEKARRWARRNRATVASAGLLLALSSVGLAVSTYLISKERDKADAATVQAEQNFKTAEKNRQIADQERLKKEAEATRALQAAKLSLDTINESLLKLGDDKVAQAPGTTDLRLEMVNLASKNLRDLKTKFPGFLEIDRVLAEALWRCGNLYKTLGRFQDAGNSYQESIQISRSLMSRSPEDPSNPRLLISALSDYLESVVRTDGAVAAEKGATELLQAIDETVRRFPDRNNIAITAAATSLPAADILYKVGKHDDAIRMLQNSAKFLTDAADRNAKDLNSAYAAIFAWIALSNVAHDKGDHSLGDSFSNTALTRAANLNQQLKNQTSENLEIMALQNEVDGAIETKQPDKADAILKELIPRLQKFAAAGQASASRQRRLAESLTSQSFVRCDQEKFAEGVADAEAALKILEDLSKKQPSADIYQGSIAYALAALALNLENLGDPKAAEVKIQALDLLKKALQAAPGINELKRLLDRLERQ
jgi:serine/threonine protein kinase